MTRLPLVGLLALALAVPAAGEGFRVPALELVHVQANTGFAAGGHVALRAGPHAYHWEVAEDGWLRLGRQDWETFRLRYGTLENRPMRVVPLALEEDARERLHTALLALWSRQRRDLAALEATATARAWAEHRAGGPPPRLPGGGFFAAAGSAPAGTALRSALEARLGARFLAGERRRLEGVLAAGIGDPLALRDTLLLREALGVLEEARGLAEGTLIDAESGDPGARPLAPDERGRLLEFREALVASLVRLLESSRSDRGRPLLLAAARYHAVQASLAEGRLLWLDALGEPGEGLDPRLSDAHRALVEALAERAARGWRRARAGLGDAPLDEPAYNQLEEAATGAHEVRAALGEGRPMRARRLGRLLPGRLGPIRPAGPAGVAPDVAAAQRAEAALRGELAERYRYDLLLRNCATELAEVLRLAAPATAPGALAFVPRRLAGDVAASGAAGPVRELPTWRRAQVEAASRGPGGLGVRLRESNTLTARLYPGSVRDHHFLFFADGSPWLRPLQGAGNLLYGLGQAAAGVATSPLDRGDRLWRGLQGAFYSVPELVGVSIRKGRYDLLPQTHPS